MMCIHKKRRYCVSEAAVRPWVGKDLQKPKFRKGVEKAGETQTGSPDDTEALRTRRRVSSKHDVST